MIDEVKEGEPIVLTKNGVGKAVLVNIDEWQRREAEIWLINELNERNNNFGEGKNIENFAKEYELESLMKNNYQVIKSSAFDNDILKIVEYLNRYKQSPILIKKVLEKIYNDLIILQSTPRIGKRLADKIQFENEYKYLISNKYIIYYNIVEVEKIIRVLGIYHSKENYLVKLNFD